jgi:DNA-binding GntR family transcriptional regulator
MEKASDRAYTILRDEIIGWDLQPGTVVAEVEQSERLGMSRTPVREALARLAADGLVVALPGRGLVVTGISVDDIRELFELREALEVTAAKLAAKRGDEAVFRELEAEFEAVPELVAHDDPARHAYYELVARFDAAVDQAVANPYFSVALSNVRTHLARVRRLSKDNPQRLLSAAAEHLLIVRAIASADVELAANATHVHLHNSLANVLASAATSLERTA